MLFQNSVKKILTIHLIQTFVPKGLWRHIFDSKFHMVRGENQLFKVVLWSTYECGGVYVSTHTLSLSLLHTYTWGVDKLISPARLTTWAQSLGPTQKWKKTTHFKNKYKIKFNNMFLKKGLFLHFCIIFCLSKSFFSQYDNYMTLPVFLCWNIFPVKVILIHLSSHLNSGKESIRYIAISIMHTLSVL